MRDKPDISIFEPAEPAAKLTLQKVKQISKDVKQFHEKNPFVVMGRLYGFDLENGDKVLVPSELMKRLRNERRAESDGFNPMDYICMHKGIHVTCWAKQIIFLRKEIAERLFPTNSPANVEWVKQLSNDRTEGK